VFGLLITGRSTRRQVDRRNDAVDGRADFVAHLGQNSDLARVAASAVSSACQVHLGVPGGQSTT
jgi:hypothetical protein